MVIIGGFTGFIKSGGIQSINRHSAAIIAKWAKEEGEDYIFLSLNDPGGNHTFSLEEFPVIFSGSNKKKLHFVQALIRAHHKGAKVFLAHPNFAPLGLLLRNLDSSCKYYISAYGIDIWKQLSWLHREGLKKSEAILSLSSFTTAQIVGVQKVPSEKVVTLPPALDPEFGHLAFNEIRQDSNTGKDRFILLTVARLSIKDRLKGVDCVILALARLVENIPSIQYIVVGEGNDKARLHRMAEANGVAEKVNFVGEKNGKELQEFYESCDVFVMPSKKEGFGIVFLEAMAYSKATIGGNHGGTPDVIVGGETGFLVEHMDIDTLVDRLHLLFTDKLLRHEMGRKGQKRVEENFTFEHYREGLLKVIADKG